MNKYWRELDPKPTESEGEFPPGGDMWPEGLSRRHFLELAAATLGATTLSGCVRGPMQKIVPYVKTPESSVSGVARHYSTAYTLGGVTHGLLAETHEGRPTKIDGHPLHPANRGAASAVQQALILSLYDQQRSARVRCANRDSSWDEFHSRWHWPETGSGVVFVTEICASPSLRAQMQALQKHYPDSRWYEYEPLASAGDLVADFARAEVVVSFAADLFGSPLFPLSASSDWLARRRAGRGGRLFVAESTPTLTGAWTDSRHLLRASAMPTLAGHVLEVLNGMPTSEPWASEVAAAVKASPGRALFLAGEYQPESVHRFCRELNRRFGAECAKYVAPPAGRRLTPARLQEELRAPIAHLFVVGGNPAYNLPGFADVIKRSANSYRLGLTEDETSQACTWHLPLSHPFETWSDAEDAYGVTFAQPLIAPLFNGHSLPELVEILMGGTRDGHELLATYWRGVWGANFDTHWETAIREGFWPRPAPALAMKALTPPPSAPPAHADLEILFRADPWIGDGRFANNPWLQELPKPLSLLTWENVAWVSPTLARERGLENGQKIEVRVDGVSVVAPVWIMPGQEARTVTLFFGYGRTHAGKIGTGLGYNAYPLWNGEFCRAGEIYVRQDKVELASTQVHHHMNEGEPVRTVKPGQDLTSAKSDVSLYPEHPSTPQAKEAWGMVIDLDSCIGCSACMVACQSENNIPVVGKAGVRRGREMHWIRVDRYYAGPKDNPRTYFQPVPCMQCEKAPCEVVCPVGATTHSSDGLNQMVYNRCVGTRYCSNNCPYKVRRFNFLSYNSDVPSLAKMAKNPDVSVRARGVMEKCTYCVQRIERARIQAEIERRPIRDGEVRTACQVTCPTQAIVFGDLRDKSSAVAAKRASGRNYTLLEHLGTRPRTTYLAKISERGEA